MIHWQDTVIAVGTLIFVIALIPSVISKDKPSLWTSTPTGIVLAIFALTYFSLSLWYAAVTTSLTALLWIILAIQKAKQLKS